MAKHNKRVVEATNKFTDEFFGFMRPDYGLPMYSAQSAVWELVYAAFKGYQESWSTFDIRNWMYPFHIMRGQLGYKKGEFEGNEPWTVLLREAAKLARKNKLRPTKAKATTAKKTATAKKTTTSKKKAAAPTAQ